MSMNHIYSEVPEAIWWSHYAMDDSSLPAKTSSTYHKPFITSSTTSHNSSTPPMFRNRSNAVAFDLNNSDDDENSDEHAASAPPLQEIPTERLFEKPLTPSDVGKLNRLVIPKQHAEKHFPLSGADSSENSLLLGFEDELGKSWRFRYSYWNSSQSYVLTKGWSRFVKEKHLDAGDIVVFSRHSSDTARHFIGWRRRSSIGAVGQPAPPVSNGGGAGWGRMIYSAHPYPIQQQPIHAGLQRGSGNSKTLRLFGVNLECQADESEPSTPVGSPMSAQAQPHHHPYHHNHMDINFSGADVYRQR